MVMGGQSYKEIGYMRGDPKEKIIEKYVRKLRAMGVDIHTQNHQTIVGTRNVKVEKTGIVLDEIETSKVPFRSPRP